MMEREIWKDIPNYEGYYQVSTLGNVRSLNRVTNNGRRLKGRLMKLGTDKDGYKQLSLNKNGVKKVKPVHKLVAITFLNHKPKGLLEVVDHINEIKSDNRLINLQLLDHRNNVIKSIKGGTSKYIGVSWFSNLNKWRATISINGKQKHLGLFECELEASKAYQNAINVYLE